MMTVAPSPVVGLNRAIAIGQRDGPERGLQALREISNADRLRRYPFYPAALGEFELRRGAVEAARAHFAMAASLARNPSERRFLGRRLRECGDTADGSDLESRDPADRLARARHRDSRLQP
jgi:RNA polymerase sigma-70 factor (ECF subfamily)